MILILASQSPRRTQLLTQIGLPHKVVAPEGEEIVRQSAPEKVVMELAQQKAETVFHRCLAEYGDQEFTVLGADTIVAQNGQILGKPRDEKDAFRMLFCLQGKTHQVYTGAALLVRQGKDVKKSVFFTCSQVHVYPMTEEEIRAYICTGEPMDKAGAYGIQGAFAAYVEGIEGDYNTIVGLPVARIYRELRTLVPELVNAGEKPLEEMTNEELWRLFPIRLTEHDEKWAQWFDEEKSRLSVSCPVSLSLSHIGSTAVPGIWAKPIVDILAETSPDEMEEAKHFLCGQGYRVMCEGGKRIDLNKGYTEKGLADRVFHLHLRENGDHDELFFRDYLIAHPDAAKQYEALKLQLWEEYPYHRDAYTEGKTEFVKTCTQLAKEGSIHV